MSGPRIVTCTPAQEQMIRRALQVIATRLSVGVCGLGGLERLRRQMLDRLMGRTPMDVVCSQCEGMPADGYTPEEKNLVGLCPATFKGGQDRVTAVLFHEMVHACGGEEMDSEGLEVHCFNGQSATMPGRSDYRLFEKRPYPGGMYAGRYLVWNPLTGQVFVMGPHPGMYGPPLGVRFRRPERP